MKIDPNFIATFKSLPTVSEMATALAKRYMSAARAALFVGVTSTSMSRLISNTDGDSCYANTYRKLVIAYLDAATYNSHHENISLIERLKKYQDENNISYSTLANDLDITMPMLKHKMDDDNPIGVELQNRIEKLISENK